MLARPPSTIPAAPAVGDAPGLLLERLPPSPRPLEIGRGEMVRESEGGASEARLGAALKQAWVSQNAQAWVSQNARAWVSSYARSSEIRPSRRGQRARMTPFVSRAGEKLFQPSGDSPRPLS